jgi:hypothetical protein
MRSASKAFRSRRQFHLLGSIRDVSSHGSTRRATRACWFSATAKDNSRTLVLATGEVKRFANAD